MKKVLFVDQAGEVGGAQMSLLDLVTPTDENQTVFLFSEGPFAEELRPRGVRLVLGDHGATFTKVSRGAGLLEILSGISSLVKLSIRACVQARDHDLIYANTQKALIVASLASMMTGKPLVWHVRDLLDADEVSKPVRIIARIFSNLFAKAVIANSTATENSYRAIGGKARTVMVYNGIDPRKFSAELGIGDRLRSKFTHDFPIVGVFSRLASWKGQHIAIEAMKNVDGVNLALVGGALFGEQGYEQALREQVIAAKLSSRVQFFGVRSDIGRLMQECDIIAHTSTSAEPFGRVVVEGMMSQKPVIATRAGGVLEIVEDGKNGLLVECSNAQELAAAIKRLLGDPELMLDLSRQARSDALSKFGVSAYRERILHFVSSI